LSSENRCDQYIFFIFEIFFFILFFVPIKVINDAIAITLFKTTAKFVGRSMGAADFFIAIIDFFVIFIGSALIGYVMGLMSAWFFKTVDLSRYRVILVSVFVGMVYIPFLLSGISFGL
jgi:NhaP-type Na+/H+ or K+/H+ antiporter